MDPKIIQLTLDVQMPPLVSLRAGKLSCLYDRGNLRTICIGETEVVRLVYPAVRDENWETAPYQIHDEVIEGLEKSFSISYIAIYALREIQYQANIIIEGKEDNSITFSMHGIALSFFFRNRIGICVHHPINGCAGRSATILSTNGLRYDACFPEFINPHQLFTEVQQMKWEPCGGLSAQLFFEGDVFETEDQRNWTDSSYKTYSTPLDLPRPVLVTEGEKIAQAVTLMVNGNSEAVDNGKIEPAHPEIKVPFPKIGYCRPAGSPRLTENELRLFKTIAFNHYRVEVDHSDEGWKMELLSAIEEAKVLDVVLELIVFFEDDIDRELRELLLHLNGNETLVSSVLVLHNQHKVTPEAVFEIAYKVLKTALPLAKIGYGTDANFAELNRNCPENVRPDFLSFSFNPQIHATDNLSIIENLEAQNHLLTTIRQHFPGIETHISPITLNKRYNPDAIQGAHSTELLPTDERQYTNFAAFWTLHCMENLADAGSLTFYQTMGERGLINYSTAGELQLSSLFKVLQQIRLFEPVYIVKKGTTSFYNDVVLEDQKGKRLIFRLDTPIV